MRHCYTMSEQHQHRYLRRFICTLLVCTAWFSHGVNADSDKPSDGVVFTSHAMAMHGEPKYPSDFSHFDFVNP